MISVFNDLVGKNAEVFFETGYHFKLEYLSCTKMRWTSLREEDKGSNEEVKIYTHDITKGIFAVNWIEKTGISVSHIIDVNKWYVWAYMNWNDDTKYGERAVLTHKGKFTILD